MSASSKNVVFVYDGNYCIDSGVVSYMDTTGNYLESNGCAVDFLVGKNESSDSRVKAIGRTITIATNGTKLDLPLTASRSKIWHTLESLEPDVLHVQAPYAPILTGRVIEAADPETQIVGTFHIAASTKAVRLATRLGSILNRNTLNRFDQFFSVSETAARTASEFYHLDTKVLPCPIDIEEFKTGQKLAEFDDGKINILFIGRLVERKGCEQLLKAVSILDEKMKQELRIIIAGRGDQYQTLQELTHKLKIDESVHFIGQFTGHKPDLYASADIACFPASKGESFGIVLAEAMAAGTPVIAGRNEGYAETLETIPQALFDPLNPMELSHVLSELITDKNKREELKNQQQELVSQFDIATKIGPCIMDAYGFINDRKMAVLL